MTSFRIERLDSSHWAEIEDLYFACENAVSERAIAKGEQPTEPEAAERTWQLWSNGMKRYYLVGDDFHYQWFNYYLLSLR